MADRAEALRARLLNTFRIEAADHLQTIQAGLEAVAGDAQGQNSRAHFENLFRAMHTLKGAARSVGILDFEGACHRCETLLSGLIESGAAVAPDDMSVLQEAADMLAGFVGGSISAEQLTRVGVKDLASPERPPSPVAQPEIAPAPAPAPAGEEARPTIRVETARLDQLVVLTENLISPKLAAAERAHEAAVLVDALRGHPTEGRARELANALSADQATLRTTVDELYEEMLRVRLMPAATMLEVFPRMVRDLCRDTGKEVTWQSTGEQMEIDRKVLELMKDPLIHMVRNAIDHGIEAPEARVAAGKPRRGSVSVTFMTARGGRVAVEVADDGRGFALDAIREAVIRSRIATAEDVAAMSDADVTELAYNAGVSTSPVVTTISGHGRGLSIVRERLERVGGVISTRSKAGAGTVIRLEFPASVITYRALLVRAGDSNFFLPLGSVDRAFSIPRTAVEVALARGELERGEETFPFGSLANVLGLAPSSGGGEESEFPCLLVRGGERQGIILVDEVLGDHEVVIKDFRPPLRRVRNFRSAGFLGTGKLVLVLRPLDIVLSLLALPTDREALSVAAAAKPLRVLVVDDSVTTRTMERNLFEAAGYQVCVAADGLDGWNMLQTERVDIVVSDVDMPNMDGFELTRRIRLHDGLGGLPVVLVTAREGLEEKERGLGAGANAYVLKSGFDQSTLLDIVRRLT